MLVLILIIIFLLLMILLLPIKFSFDIEWEQTNLMIRFVIHLAGIPCYKKEQLIELDMQEESEDAAKNSEHFIKEFKSKFDKYILYYQEKDQIQLIIENRLRRIKIHVFEWETTIGTGDAASTGMVSGLCWSIKGAVVAILTSFMRLRKPLHYQVNPVFQQKLINSTCTCIFSIRLGQAIYTMMKIGKWNKKILN